MTPSRYNEITIQSPIEFSQLFLNFSKVDCRDFITKLSRDEIVKIAIALNKYFSRKPAIDVFSIISSCDSNFKHVYDRIKSIEESKPINDLEYVVLLETTTLELLRLAFSYNNSIYQNQTIDSKNTVFDFLKLITQINESSMQYKCNIAEAGNVAYQFLTNVASFNDILHFNQKDELLYQLIRSYDFFLFIESTEKYKYLLCEFCYKYGISHWKEYIASVLSIISITKNEVGIIPSGLIDKCHFIKRYIINSFCLYYNEEEIQYSCSDEFDRCGNSDYKMFRAKPLIKMPNGDYAVYCIPFLTDKLFNSLYFDFLEISKNLSINSSEIHKMFTSQFVEKYLFCGLMNDTVNEQKYQGYNEAQLDTIYKPKNDEFGCPDYILKSKDVIILFECKDIKINAWIKEQRDGDLIERELRNKLVSKTYKTDPENNTYRNIKPKRIGCGQLAGHLRNIRNDRFPWINEKTNETIVYSVLMISDNRLLAEGLAPLIQKWYAECLTNEMLEKEKEKGVIIMSPMTLIKYSYLFKRDGFEKYFEEYYLSITQPYDNLTAYINNFISFEEYMTKYSYNLSTQGDKILKTLLEKSDGCCFK